MARFSVDYPCSVPWIVSTAACFLFYSFFLFFPPASLVSDICSVSVSTPSDVCTESSGCPESSQWSSGVACRFAVCRFLCCFPPLVLCWRENTQLKLSCNEVQWCQSWVVCKPPCLPRYARPQMPSLCGAGGIVVVGMVCMHRAQWYGWLVSQRSLGWVFDVARSVTMTTPCPRPHALRLHINKGPWFHAHLQPQARWMGLNSASLRAE